VKNTVSNS